MYALCLAGTMYAYMHMTDTGDFFSSKPVVHRYINWRGNLFVEVCMLASYHIQAVLAMPLRFSYVCVAQQLLPNRRCLLELFPLKNQHR